jgi:Ner family transcriptional regulator
MVNRNKLTNNHKESIAATRGWVKFLLSLKGYNLESVARRYGITAGCLSTVFYHPYPKSEKRIADILGICPQDLWPERYDPAGRPNRRNAWYSRGRRKNNTANPEIKEKILNKNEGEGKTN